MIVFAFLFLLQIFWLAFFLFFIHFHFLRNCPFFVMIRGFVYDVCCRLLIFFSFFLHHHKSWTAFRGKWSLVAIALFFRRNLTKFRMRLPRFSIGFNIGPSYWFNGLSFFFRNRSFILKDCWIFFTFRPISNSMMTCLANHIALWYLGIFIFLLFHLMNYTILLTVVFLLIFIFFDCSIIRSPFLSSD